MSRIIFKVWFDPLAPLVDGQEISYHPEEDEDNPDWHAAREEFGAEPMAPSYPRVNAAMNWAGPCIMGPQGIIPLRETNIPSALYQFFIGDCDFDITEDVRDLVIAPVPGVETLDVFSRYRFRIAVGRAFQASQVLQAVKEAVRLHLAPPAKAPPKTEDPLVSIQRMLEKRFSHWAIFVLPHGKFDFAGGATVDEVQVKAKRFDGVETIWSWER